MKKKSVSVFQNVFQNLSADRMIRCLPVTVILLLSTISFSNLQAQQSLEWRNGNVLPGKLIGGDEEELVWNSDLFLKPLKINFSALSNISYSGDRSDSSDPFMIRTLEGNKLFGDIVSVNDEFLVLSSARYQQNGNQQIKIAKNQINRIFHIKNSGYVLLGITNFDNWNSVRIDKKGKTKQYWKLDMTGGLVATQSNINLAYQTDLPDTVLIDLVFTWDRKLDFALGFGVPSGKKSRSKMAMIETWEDSLVFTQQEDFEAIYEKIDDSNKRLALQIQWDRKNNKVTTYDEFGKELATVEMADNSAAIKPGIYIENRAGDLKVETIQISKTVAGYDPIKIGIQQTDGTIASGVLDSFDGTNWAVKHPKTDAASTVSNSAFREALLQFPNLKLDSQTERNVAVHYLDGTLISGVLKKIESNAIFLKTSFSQDIVRADLAGVAMMQFLNMADANEQQQRHTLVTGNENLQGEICSGTGDDHDVIRWKPAGAKTGVPLANADAKITLFQGSIATRQFNPQWPDTIYFKNKDIISCKILSINEQHVQFESYTENQLVASDQVQAIDFSNSASSGNIPSDDPNWYFSDRAKKVVEIPDNKTLIFNGECAFGHESLSTTSSLKFRLNWNGTRYCRYRCSLFANNAKTPNANTMVDLELSDRMLSIKNQDGTDSSKIRIQQNTAEFEYLVENQVLIVKVNGQKAYQKQLNPSELLGIATTFQVASDEPLERFRVEITDFRIAGTSSSSASVSINEEQRELLLTIPRLRKKNPPKHILCGKNNDFLRGDLKKIDDQQVHFKSRKDLLAFDRSLVSSIVWLHHPSDNQTTDGIESAIQDEEGAKQEQIQKFTQVDDVLGKQTVQVLMKDGQRITVEARRWGTESFIGQSQILGGCKIPIEQIRELRFGSYASQATDLAYADWIPKLAPEPKMEDSDSAGAEFGKASPLVGTAVKDFQLKLLDGSTFKLSEQRGKVVVLDFWATWCSPCIKALPEIIAATNEFDSNQVILIAVNQLEEPEAIKRFMEARKLQATVGLDNGDIGDIFQVTGIPQTVIIDPEGNIAFLTIGSESDLRTKMTKAIRDTVVSSDSEGF